MSLTILVVTETTLIQLQELASGDRSLEDSGYHGEGTTSYGPLRTLLGNYELSSPGGARMYAGYWTQSHCSTLHLRKCHDGRSFPSSKRIGGDQTALTTDRTTRERVPSVR